MLSTKAIEEKLASTPELFAFQVSAKAYRDHLHKELEGVLKLPLEELALSLYVFSAYLTPTSTRAPGMGDSFWAQIEMNISRRAAWQHQLSFQRIPLGSQST